MQWASTPTVSKLGRKYHHERMSIRKWPSLVYILFSMWLHPSEVHLKKQGVKHVGLGKIKNLQSSFIPGGRCTQCTDGQSTLRNKKGKFWPKVCWDSLSNWSSQVFVQDKGKG